MYGLPSANRAFPIDALFAVPIFSESGTRCRFFPHTAFLNCMEYCDIRRYLEKNVKLLERNTTMRPTRTKPYIINDCATAGCAEPQGKVIVFDIAKLGGRHKKPHYQLSGRGNQSLPVVLRHLSLRWETGSHQFEGCNWCFES